MARIQSHVWNIARGSIAGITYLANQYHQIIARARTSPVQPNTEFQVSIKTAFSAAVEGWKVLSDEDRADWHNYSRTVIFSGPFGDYTVPGRQLHSGGYTLLSYINNLGLGPVVIDDSPPQKAGRLILGNVVKTLFTPAGETGVAVGMQLSEEGTDYEILAEVSIGFNPTRTRYKGPFNPSSAKLGSLTGLASLVLTFNGLVAGQAYFMRVRAVASGEPCRYSESFIVRSIAVENGP